MTEPESPPEGPLEVARRRATAIVEKDWDTLEAGLHAEFSYTTSLGVWMEREEFLTFYREGPVRWNGEWFEEVRVRRVGDVAILSGILMDDIELTRTRHVLRFAATQTYVLVDGRWLWLAGHTAPAAQEHPDLPGPDLDSH